MQNKMNKTPGARVRENFLKLNRPNVGGGGGGGVKGKSRGQGDI